MKPLRDPEPGQAIRASDVKDAYDAIRQLQNLSVGPGLTKRQTVGGVTIALQYPRGVIGTGGKAESCSRNGVEEDTGTITGVTSTVLTDSTKAWTVNQFAGEGLRITTAGGVKAYNIATNTPTQLTIASGDMVADGAVPGNPYSVIGPKKLAHVQGTQDTDTWVKDTDLCGVNFQFITDLIYDPASHKLQWRARTAKVDSCGKIYEITGEDDLVDITTAEECP